MDAKNKKIKMMTDSLTIYNLTFGLCFFAWAYFDTMSIIALSAHKLTENKMIPSSSMGGHIVLKGLFYLFTVIGMFTLPLDTIIAGAIGFFIAVKMARDSGVAEKLLHYKEPKDFATLIKYCNIMFISGIAFFFTIIFL